MWYLTEMFWTLTLLPPPPTIPKARATQRPAAWKPPCMAGVLSAYFPLKLKVFTNLLRKSYLCQQHSQFDIQRDRSYPVIDLAAQYGLREGKTWTELSWMMILTWQHRCCYCTESELIQIMALLSFYSCFFSVWSQNTEAHVYLFTYF